MNFKVLSNSQFHMRTKGERVRDRLGGWVGVGDLNFNLFNRTGSIQDEEVAYIWTDS